MHFPNQIHPNRFSSFVPTLSTLYTTVCSTDRRTFFSDANGFRRGILRRSLCAGLHEVGVRSVKQQFIFEDLRSILRIMASLTEPTRKSDVPPPLIGKAGRYTVFITPPPVASPRPSPKAKPSPKPSPKPKSVDVESQASPPRAQSKASKAAEILPESFKTKVSDTVTKIQNAYIRVDEVLADWFGLNQSKYQWALNEYMERKEMETEDGKPRETVVKGQEMKHVPEQVMKDGVCSLFLSWYQSFVEIVGMSLKIFGLHAVYFCALSKLSTTFV